MNKISIGKSVLKGTVSVSGAKNSVLKLLTASILTSSNVIIYNYPSDLLDAQIHFQMLEALGKTCKVTGEDTLISLKLKIFIQHSNGMIDP